jgi:hypothetical protein
MSIISTTNLLIALLVPLVVSFVLFKFLHSSAAVNGKIVQAGIFKGIQFDLGGAFAAYVIMAAGLLYFYSYQVKLGNAKIWFVKGNVKLGGSDKNTSLNPSNIEIKVIPTTSNKVLENGRFDIIVVGDRENFPSLAFRHPGFHDQPIEIFPRPGVDQNQQDYDIEIQEDTKKILINKCIELKPDFQPTASNK